MFDLSTKEKMTIEELREKYTTLEKEHNELSDKFNILTKESEADKKRITELENYNRKMFNDYVLSKPEEKTEKETGPTLDDLATKMTKNFK